MYYHFSFEQFSRWLRAQDPDRRWPHYHNPVSAFIAAQLGRPVHSDGRSWWLKLENGGIIPWRPTEWEDPRGVVAAFREEFKMCFGVLPSAALERPFKDYVSRFYGSLPHEADLYSAADAIRTLNREPWGRTAVRLPTRNVTIHTGPT